LSEIDSIIKEGVTKEELDFIKDKIYKSTNKNFQTSEDWVNANSSHESLCGDGKTQIDFINEMMKISNKEIIDTVSKYLSKEKAFVGYYSKNKK